MARKDTAPKEKEDTPLKRNFLTVTGLAAFALAMLLTFSGCGSGAAGTAPEKTPEPTQNAEQAVPSEPARTAETASPTETPTQVTEAPAEAETDAARQDGERFESVIILEGMEETVRYEHIRNERLGFEMDYDYEQFERRSEADRERFVSVYDDPEHPENYLEVTRSAEDAETVAAAISEELSKTYEIDRSEYPMERAGSCIRIDASADVGGLTMPDHLQMVYIIPADDGCRVAAAHYFIVGSEGFGRRFAYLMQTFSVID